MLQKCKLIFLQKLKEQKGASILLMVCLFLLFCVLGINLLNAANANTSDTSLELQKEQTMLYVSSVYEIVNDMIEAGEFSDAATGQLPDAVETTAGGSLTDAEGHPVTVHIAFQQGTIPIIAEMTISCTDETGTPQEYKIDTTYSNGAVLGTYKRESCRGLKDE